MRRHLAIVTVVVLALVGFLAVPTPAAETPRPGGVVLSVIGADAPSLDPHQASTFATRHPVARPYSTLLQIDPHKYPNQKLQDVWLSEG